MSTRPFLERGPNYLEKTARNTPARTYLEQEVLLTASNPVTNFEDFIIDAEDGAIGVPEQTQFLLKGGGRGQRFSRKRKGGGHEGGHGSSGGRRGSKADRAHEAMSGKLGYGWSGYLKDGVGAIALTAVAYPILNSALYVKSAAQIGAVLSFLGIELTSLAAVGALALVPGAAGAAYWAFKKLVKGTIGRLGAFLLPRTTKAIDDSVASLWLWLDKTAYQATRTTGETVFGTKSLFLDFVLSPVAVAGFAYMYLRACNGIVGSALNGEWTKMRLNAKSLVQPGTAYKELIDEEEKEINNTNWILRFVNWVTNVTSDNPTPSVTEHAIAEHAVEHTPEHSETAHA